MVWNDISWNTQQDNLSISQNNIIITQLCSSHTDDRYMMLEAGIKGMDK